MLYDTRYQAAWWPDARSPGVRLMPYRVIDTWEKYSIVLYPPPTFTFGIPLTSYITYRQTVGDRDKYSL